jgi:hypothetical protein
METVVDWSAHLREFRDTSIEDQRMIGSSTRSIRLIIRVLPGGAYTRQML